MKGLPFIFEGLCYKNEMYVLITAGGKSGNAALSHRAVKELVVVNDDKRGFCAGIAGNEGGYIGQIFQRRSTKFQHFIRYAVFRAAEKGADAPPCPVC